MWASANATQKVFTSVLTTVGLTVKLQSPVSLLSTPQVGTGKKPTGEKIDHKSLNKQECLSPWMNERVTERAGKARPPGGR